MDLSQSRIYQIIRQKMHFAGERQAVLAQNVANANTPGYIAKDLKKVDFKALAEESAMSGGLVTTNPKHISASKSGGGGKFKIQEMADSEVTPSGNGVVLEEQMLKIAENNADYQATTSVYKKMIELMRIASGGGR